MSMIEGLSPGKNAGQLNKSLVTSDGRMLVDSVQEPISSERSRTGNLFGLGSGFLTTSGSMDFGGVLWLRNDAKDEDLYVETLIFGWNGGSTNFNRVIRSFIKYNTDEPTANHAEIDDQIENISLSGANDPVKSGKIKGYKWDGVGNGFTSGAGGFLQIPNQISQGNTSIPIKGEIILGPGNSMEMQAIDDQADQEAGIYNISIVYYFAPLGAGRSGI